MQRLAVRRNLAFFNPKAVATRERLPAFGAVFYAHFEQRTVVFVQKKRVATRAVGNVDERQLVLSIKTKGHRIIFDREDSRLNGLIVSGGKIAHAREPPCEKKRN